MKRTFGVFLSISENKRITPNHIKILTHFKGDVNRKNENVSKTSYIANRKKLICDFLRRILS